MVLDIEHSRVRSIREEGICSSQEAERHHQHELAIWDKKVELSWLKTGALSSYMEPNPAIAKIDRFGSTREISGHPYSSSPSSSGLHLSLDLTEGNWGSQGNASYSDLMGRD